MTWKVIGQAVVGTSHIAGNRPCEDAVAYKIVKGQHEQETLLCCVSDGAGSAAFGQWAAHFVATETVSVLEEICQQEQQVSENTIFQLAEDLYDRLCQEAVIRKTALREFSCTFLGCVLGEESATFFQIGDGAIVKSSGGNFLTAVCWPQNGEYQNTTTFLIEDKYFRSLFVRHLEERVDEVALFTDGLQHLVLNSDSQSVHQPFFSGMFKALRGADAEQKVDFLNSKLSDYLNSDTINRRTDDDKTLLLATRAVNDIAGLK